MAQYELCESIHRYFELGSRFIQVVVPIDKNSIDIQKQLHAQDFQAFGYEPASEQRSASLLFGKVKCGFKVVPTHWDDEKENLPFWQGELTNHARRIANAWPLHQENNLA